MMSAAFSTNPIEEDYRDTGRIDTTLYELIAAVADEVEPGEEHLVAEVVSRILHYSQRTRLHKRLTGELSSPPLISARFVCQAVEIGSFHNEQTGES